MDQLELPWIYDIRIDKSRPVNARDFEIYQEAYLAYGEVRAAMCRVYGYAELISALDEIHNQFKKRINL